MGTEGGGQSSGGVLAVCTIIRDLQLREMVVLGLGWVLSVWA